MEIKWIDGASNFVNAIIKLKNFSKSLELLLHPAQKTNPIKKIPENTQRIPLRCTHRKGVARCTTAARSRARPSELCPTMATHNKIGQILYYKMERPLSRRHQTKYKVYWMCLVSGIIGE